MAEKRTLADEAVGQWGIIAENVRKCGHPEQLALAIEGLAAVQGRHIRALEAEIAEHRQAAETRLAETLRDLPAYKALEAEAATLRAERDELRKALPIDQYCQCGMGASYRCYDCDGWYCVECSRAHFGREPLERCEQFRALQANNERLWSVLRYHCEPKTDMWRRPCPVNGEAYREALKLGSGGTATDTNTEDDDR